MHLSGGYMAVAADLRTAVTNAINATTDVNRLTSKATNNIIPLPLYNPTLGYESLLCRWFYYNTSANTYPYQFYAYCIA